MGPQLLLRPGQQGRPIPMVLVFDANQGGTIQTKAETSPPLCRLSGSERDLGDEASGLKCMGVRPQACVSDTAFKERGSGEPVRRHGAQRSLAEIPGHDARADA